VKEGATTGGVKVGSSGKAVLADIVTPLGTIPAPGPTLDFTNPFGPLSPINPNDLGIPNIENPLGIGGAPSLFSIPKEIIEAFQQFTKISELLTSPKFWIRVGEATGGIILLYMALKALTGTSVSDVPGVKTGTKIGKDAAAAAAFKRLPPAQRVK
jgi:hypothetical protein